MIYINRKTTKIFTLIIFLFFASSTIFAINKDENKKSEKEILITEILKIVSERKEKNEKLNNEDIQKIIFLANIFSQKNKFNNTITPKNSSYENFSYVFKIGVKDFQTNGEVSKLQKKLISDGFLNDVADGQFGPKTANAVEKMKKSLGIFDKKYGEFNPSSLYSPEKNKQKYNPKKITEFLGSDQLEFYSLKFPFSESSIKNISCSDRGTVKHIFKNNKIIFPISFPYYSKTNKISCFLETSFSNKKINFLDIVKKEVARKIIHVTLNKNATKKYIAPKKSDIDRAAAEKIMLKELFKNADRNKILETPFAKPTNSIVTSPFGVTRVFNGTRKSYHSGTDFRAYTGAPLKSINSGTVILSKNLFYCGNAVIINHGSGIFSTYCHLSESKVSEGQNVNTGDIIGLSGATGRVSAAHLHLSIKYDNNGTFQYIDFLDMLNRSQNLK